MEIDLELLEAAGREAEIEVYHGVLLPLPVGLRDRQVPEELLPPLEDRLESADHQRLAEAPRTRQEEAVVGAGEQFVEIRGLVDVEHPFSRSFWKEALSVEMGFGMAAEIVIAIQIFA